MKNKFFITSCLITVCIAVSSISFGQKYNLNEKAPLDSKIRTGILENGMRYFIRANKMPANRGEFYIAHNVGAIQEEDNQNGLAHFTEHMAFNGTKNFPKKRLLEYLATIGVKFGTNVNAGTGVEQTVYNLSNVPLVREGIIDTCLLILHDWSNCISFDSDEIDAERGVIREEWRMYGSANERMNNKLSPIIYKGSKYAKRNVIGDTAVINHFSYQTIKDFYHRWYRTDLQAIVVVGDFDVDKMEAKIKKLFSTIPAVKNPEKKQEYAVPDNDEPLIGIATDSEATRTMVSVYFKHNHVKEADKNLNYMRSRLVNRIISLMLMQRMSEISKKENPPFMNAFGRYGEFTRSKDAFSVTALAKEGEALKALKAVLIEMERMKKFGFINSEFERAKADILRAYETQFNEREKSKNNQLVRPITSYFLTGNPNPGPEFDFEFAKYMIPSITLEELNKTAKGYITDKNQVISITTVEKQNVIIPSEKDVKEILIAYKNEKIEPYVDYLSGKKLIEKEPTAGKIIKSENNQVFGTTEWTLSNGIKVVFKQTDFKAEEVILNGFCMGGLSQVAENDVIAGQFVSNVVAEMGVSDFSSSDLTKLLAGKSVSLNIGITADKDMILGNLSIKDFETAMQLIYLYFTKPRWNEMDFKTYMGKLKANFSNVSSDPRKAFADTVSVMTNNHHFRARPITMNNINEITFEKVKMIFNQRFGSASNFTFVFTGAVNPEIVKPFIEKYIASLPTSTKISEYKDNALRFPKGKAINDFKKANKTPRTTVAVYYNIPCNYSNNDMLMMAAIRHCLELRYVQKIREEKGGTYSVGVAIQFSKLPVNYCNLRVGFDTDPKLSDELVAIVHEQIKEMIKNGPSETELQKAKEYFLKTRQENLKDNGWWANTIFDYYTFNNDNLSGYEENVKKLTVNAVKEFAANYLSKANIIDVYMRPL